MELSLTITGTEKVKHVRAGLNFVYSNLLLKQMSIPVDDLEYKVIQEMLEEIESLMKSIKLMIDIADKS